eukprot:gene18164-24596_t
MQDLDEMDSQYEITADVPGMHPKEITVDVSDNKAKLVTNAKVITNELSRCDEFSLNVIAKPKLDAQAELITEAV